MVKSLQSLRGIFALMIFAHHYPWGGQSGQFDAGGDCGVTFFFILSGFALSIGAERDKDGPRWLPFMGRRLSRIYPLHIICLILFFLLNPAAHIGLWLPANLLLLQAWVPVEGIYFSGNAVGWCLSDFLLFYSLFPLLHRLRCLRPRLFVALSLAYIAATVTASAFVDREMVTPLLYISPPARLSDFLLGMLLFAAFGRMGLTDVSPARATWLEAGAAAAVAISFTVYGCIPSRWGVAIFWWPSMAAVITVFYLTARAPGLISRLLLLRPFRWMGSISFPYYMSHNLTLRALTLATGTTGLSAAIGHGPLHLLLSLATTLLAGFLLTRLLPR